MEFDTKRFLGIRGEDFLEASIAEVEIEYTTDEGFRISSGNDTEVLCYYTMYERDRESFIRIYGIVIKGAVMPRGDRIDIREAKARLTANAFGEPQVVYIANYSDSGDYNEFGDYPVEDYEDLMTGLEEGRYSSSDLMSVQQEWSKVDVVVKFSDLASEDARYPTGKLFPIYGMEDNKYAAYSFIEVVRNFMSVGRGYERQYGQTDFHLTEYDSASVVQNYANYSQSGNLGYSGEGATFSYRMVPVELNMLRRSDVPNYEFTWVVRR